MKQKVKLFINLVLILVICSSVLEAKDKFEWDPITNGDWSVVKDSIKEITVAAIIFEKIWMDEEKLDDEKIYYTIYRRIRIVDKDGRDAADYDLPILDKGEKIEFIEGRTILRDGTIIPLTKENIFENEVIKSKKSKYKQKSFSMPGVTDDCILEYAIKYRFNDKEHVWLAQKEYPLLRADLEWIFYRPVVSPYYYSIIEKLGPAFDYTTPNFIWLNGEGKMKFEILPSKEKPEKLHFTIDYLPPFESEPYDLPEEVIKTKLVTYYGSPDPPRVYWNSWSEHLGKLFMEITKESEKLKEIVVNFEHLSSTDEKIKTAFEWVQDSIYNLTYFDLKDPKDSNKIIESKDRETIDDIIKYGYGSRLDITLLFYKMLIEMGFNAKIAYVVDRTERFFIQSVKYWQFDYPIVAVLEKGIYKYYAPGMLNSKYDLLPYYMEGVDVYITQSDEMFDIIPFSKPENTINKMSYSYKFSDEFEIFGSAKTRLFGHDARYYRMQTYDVDDINKVLKEEIEDTYINAEVDSIIALDLNNPREQLSLDFNLSYPSLTQQGNRILLKPFDYFLEKDNPFVDDERKSDILFRNPYQLNESAQFEIPEGWELEAIPEKTEFKSSVGSCIVYYNNVSNLFSVQRMITLNAPFWRKDNYKAIQEFFNAIQKVNESIIVMKQT